MKEIYIVFGECSVIGVFDNRIDLTKTLLKLLADMPDILYDEYCYYCESKNINIDENADESEIFDKALRWAKLEISQNENFFGDTGIFTVKKFPLNVLNND